MGLFSKKKEDKGLSGQVPNSTAIQEFPEFPMHEEANFPEFPSYEPSISEIKSEVSKGSDDFEVPKRDSKVDRRLPSVDLEAKPDNTRRFDESKPLFVQIDKYKDVVNTIQAIKSKMRDLEELISNLENIKVEEDKKLDSWKRDVQNIKEKILSIDKDLFEV